MSKFEMIQQHNEGIDYPEKYDETYIATKHVQSYELEIATTIYGMILKYNLIKQAFSLAMNIY